MKRYLRGLGPNSRRTLRAALRAGARKLTGDQRATEHEWSQPGALAAGNVDRVVRALFAEGKRPSAALLRAALRGLARKAFTLASDGPHADRVATIRRAIDDVKVKGLHTDSGRRRGRAWKSREVERLMQQCRVDENARGARDAGLVACLFGGGLRRFEVAALDVTDYQASAGTLPARLNIMRGKGDKYGVAGLPPDAAAAIEAWLEIRGREPGALFYRFPPRGDAPTRERLTTDGIYFTLRKRARTAGVAYCGTHDGRRTIATTMLDEGHKLTTVQRVLRQSDISTTSRYDRSPEEEAIAALARTVRVGYAKK